MLTRLFSLQNICIMIIGAVLIGIVGSVIKFLMIVGFGLVVWKIIDFIFLTKRPTGV